MAADEGELLADCSVEVAGKDVAGLAHARTVLPPGSQFHLAFVDSEDLATRMRTTRAIMQAGFVPVPVISARRLESPGMLWQYLGELRAAGASERVTVVGGDPPQPRGPYPDAASVIASGALEQHGVQEVSVTGHPGGHPAVPDIVLWQAIAAKTAALAQRGYRERRHGEVKLHFSTFGGVAATADWISQFRPERVRAAGPA